MHFFWNKKFFRKGVFIHHFIWTGPQSCPKISQYPDFNQYYKKQICSNLGFKRNASRFPSFQASITVESAIALPLFLFFCIQMISIISLIHLHSVVEAALHQEAAKAALHAYAYDKLGISNEAAAGFLEDIYLKNKVIQRAGQQYLDHSMIKNGSRGIHIICTEEKNAQDTVDVVLFYKVEPAIDLLGFSGFAMGNRCRMKKWTGYQVDDALLSENNTEELVYITETGNVYHKNRNCTHLALSIHAVKTNSLGVLRNEDGGKYYACESCGKNAGYTVYVTDQGNRYHTSLVCSGLKRTVYSVRITEAGGRGPCSRCSVME